MVAVDRMLVGTVLLGGVIIIVIKNLLRGPRSAGHTDVSSDVQAVRNGVPFKVISAILASVDDILWILRFRFLSIHSSKMHSYAKPGEPGTRVRNPDVPLTVQCEGSNTVFEIVSASVKKFKNCPAFATRTFLGETEPEGAQKTTKKIFGETTYQNYGEVGERIMCFGAALRAIGVVPFMGTAKEYETSAVGKSCIMIFENTCAEWTTAFFGATSQSVVVATSYSTLGFDSMLDSVDETGSLVLVCNRSVVNAVAMKGDKTLKVIVYTNNYIAPEVAAQPMPNEINGIRIFSMDQFITIGKENPIAPTPPTPDTLAVIMYTSGSTGKPKGVMLTHQNVTAAAGGAVDTLMQSGKFELEKEVYLAYLPAAHILELTVEVVLFSAGGMLGYADPRSISSNGAVRRRPDGTMNTLPEFPYPPGAIQEFRPTVMAGVPKIWDVLKSGAVAKIGTMKPIVQAIIFEMIACRDASLRNGTDSPLFSFIFAKRFGVMVGGRLKSCISGGGPLSSSTQTFVRAVMCSTFVQGYGLTETNGATCVQDLFQVADGIAGVPLGSVELKLNSVVEVQDTNGKPYMATDTEHIIGGKTRIPCLGRGELWVRGPTVSKGYYKLPDKTNADFLADGWFKTGDICIWTEDGSIKIVDRLKNLVKLRGGEYVALENMEKEYAQSVYVNQIAGGVMVIADGEMDRSCLIAQANLVQIMKLAKTLGVEGEPEQLCRNPAIEKAVLADMIATAMPSLAPLEKIVGIRLLPGTAPGVGPMSENTPWTVENGGLLASNKLGRQTIQKELSELVRELKQKGIQSH